MFAEVNDAPCAVSTSKRSLAATVIAEAAALWPKVLPRVACAGVIAPRFVSSGNTARAKAFRGAYQNRLAWAWAASPVMLLSEFPLWR